MTSDAKKGFLTPKERSAFAWLWRGYLRKRLPILIFLSVLVTLHGLTMVGFLSTLQNSFGSFFDSTQGAYVFTDDVQSAHREERMVDANGDGLYEFLITVSDESGKASAPVPLAVRVQSSQITADRPVARFPNLISSVGIVAFDPGQALSLFSSAEALKVESVEGPDADLVAFEGRQTKTVLAWLVLILTTLIIFRAIVSYVAARLAARVATRASLEIRSDLVSRLMSLDLAYFDLTPPGRLVLRIYGMVSQVEAFFSRQIILAAQQSATIILILLYLLWVHAGLFLFVFIAMPIALWGMRIVTERVRRYSILTNDALAHFLTGMEDTLTGIRTVKLTNQSERAQNRLTAYSKDIADLQYGIARNQAIMTPFVDLLAAMSVILIVGLGGLAVINGWGGLTASTLVTFVVGLALVFDPARILSRFNATLAQLIVAVREIHELDEERPQIADKPDALTEFETSGSIEIESMSFSYGGEEQENLFSNLSLTLPGGKTSALVGQTGSGKTTLLSLIARLYEPSEGKISIGGTDVKDLAAFSLRDAFSVVSQEIFIFDATIEENVRFVAPEASDEQMAEAIEKAQLTTLIADKGTGTVGPRGAQLSGGQKQRIAIARAFLKDAPIVLLDEATSALDQQTEAKITDALRELCAGKTTLIIAHRLSTIRHADDIFVLEQGKVAEHGSHSELIAKQGLYAALYKAQQSGVDTQKSRWFWPFG